MFTFQLQQQLRSARILIVDEAASARLLENALESAGYTSIVSTSDARQAQSLIKEERPALLLLDLALLHSGGLAFLEQIKTLGETGEDLPVLVLTDGLAFEERAFEAGAFDLVKKPFDPLEVSLRVRNMLALGQLYREQRASKAKMEARITERTQQLAISNQLLERANSELASANAYLVWAHQEIEQAQEEIVERLAEAVEVRADTPPLKGHRVGELAQQVACRMNLDPAQVELIRHAAPLHDIGKIGVSDAVLLKPAALSPAEWEEVKSHVEIGASMLSESDSPLMQMAHSIALTHHERWDGQGYPRGLKGEETPIEGRILAVVDVFDALTTERPYKRAWTTKQALAEIQAQSGHQFDPAVVEAFSALMGCKLDDPVRGDDLLIRSGTHELLMYL